MCDDEAARSRGDEKPFRTILVPTDFSSNAEIALRWATKIARDRGAKRIVIVHAIETVSTMSLPLSLQETVAESLRAVEGVVRDAGIAVESIYRIGKPWEVVARVAREVESDLIVLGARGRTIYERLLMGSSADRILRTAESPVLTAHPGDLGWSKGISSVLVATDFSDEASLVTSAAMRLLDDGARKRRIVLLHAWQPIVEYGFGTGPFVAVCELNSTEEQVHHVLDHLAATIADENITVEPIVRCGYPAAIIEEEATAHGVDLVALGTHGRSGIGRFMMGSVAERVVRRAKCPVLTVRHPAATGPLQLSVLSAP